MVSTPPGYFNITSAYPSGPEVYLNEPIIIGFSEPVDDNNIMVFISFDPALTNTAFERSDENMTLVIQHDDLLPNTTYTITISADLLSALGNKLWEGPYVWNFTTGSDIQLWMINGKVVTVGTDKKVTIEATGEMDMMVYFVVEDTGSYLLTEGPAGTYKGTIAGTSLEWNTTYSYHFSDADGGTDKAPSFAGTFKTPVKPIVWRLDTATVEIDDDGNWVVTAEGEPGIEVWIVIEGVGSFKLTEGTPGHYTVTIPDGRFDEGKEYDYWFSNVSGGADKSPILSGKQKAKGEEGFDNNLLILCCAGIIVVVVLLLIVMVFILIVRKGKKGSGEE
jgi:Bacterial Ig-like domain